MAEPFGEILLKTRLERGESLEQVSSALHLRPRYLQALEEEDYSALPSNVQGKGYLRMYAGYLGLSAEPLLENWGKKIKLPAGAPLPELPAKAPAVAIVEAAAAEVSIEVQSPAPVLLEPDEDEIPAELETLPGPESEVQTFESPLLPDELALEPEKELLPPKASDLLVRIGQQLRQQREDLNLSLADVERHTHVRLRYLAALEGGRLEDLPSPVQGRGMLSNYSGFLQLDTDALLSIFAEALQARRLEFHARQPVTRKNNTPRRRAEAKPPSTLRRLLTPDLLLGSALIVILFGFAVWAASKITSVQNEQAAATPLSIAEILLQTTTPLAVIALTPSPLPNIGTRIPGDNSAAGAAAASSLTAPAATITLPAVGTGSLQVAIVTRMSTYMRVTVDGKVAFDGRAIVGNAYPFGGDKQIELLIGNAAALQVFFNQTDMGNLGLVGEVKTLIFTKSGVVTPTPMFTITSSPTSTKTATARPSQTVPVPTITPYIP
jgi:cytoskeleton protein RodZ